VSISRDVTPAPCISPLKPNFADDVEQVAEALNSLRPGAVEVRRFGSLGEFAGLLAELARDARPYTLAVAERA
jgi:hypothetical protein